MHNVCNGSGSSASTACASTPVTDHRRGRAHLRDRDWRTRRGGMSIWVENDSNLVSGRSERDAGTRMMAVNDDIHHVYTTC
jgi:hypothetical protein